MAAVVAALAWTGSAGLGRVMASMADFIELMGDQPTQIVAGTMFSVVTTAGLTRTENGVGVAVQTVVGA